MAVRVSDTIKQQNDLTTFPVAFGSDIWLDKNKGSGTPDYKGIQQMYNDNELGGGSQEVVFFNLPAEDDWEDENVIRPFYNQLKSAIDNGKFIIVTEKLSGDFDSWVYYTVAYNSVDSSEEDQEWINLTSFDGIYVDVLEIHPVSISKTETEMKGEVIVELDKTDIHSVYEELFDIFEQTTPVLHEKVGHADYYWKFINDEEDESIGSVTGYVFLCSKNGELHKLVIKSNSYQETIVSNKEEIDEKFAVINKSINDNWQGNGYNLIPYPYYEGSSKEASGITFTVSNDGSVSVSGTATSDVTFTLQFRLVVKYLMVKAQK